jgi:hypothetical protein
LALSSRECQSWLYTAKEKPQEGEVFGKTPMQTFPDATPLAKEKMIAA